STGDQPYNTCEQHCEPECLDLGGVFMGEGVSCADFGTVDGICRQINVDASYDSDCSDLYCWKVQNALDEANDGDLVYISHATHSYELANLSMGGKKITIAGKTNSDGEPVATLKTAAASSSVFYLHEGETNQTVIKDLVISGGSAEQGGGIYCENSNPTIINCTIKDNTASYGGGIFVQNSNPTITDCTISNNSASGSIYGGFGGGIYCSYSSSLTITNCTISDNTATNYGGGISCENSNPTITGCTIEGNTASTYTGGGIGCYASSPVHSGCTFSNNTPDNVYGDSDWNPLRGEGGPSMITLENCTLCGTGEHIGGNIPILHLGDNHISDCIDDGDLDGDGDVDTDDLNALHDALGINNTDVNNNGCVDIDDLLLVIEDWNEGCTP
ncbi:MAG: right-handed parallel beta-helix repeat-containing protein, partial [Phycisphaerales bacterium]|nr:right-handed parallel beta-helix repeat-containing protein [Phycisphaerales bacterium]